MCVMNIYSKSLVYDLINFFLKLNELQISENLIKQII